MRFVKGQSGNPGGRLKAVVEVAELARRETVANVQALVRVRDSEASPPAAVVAASVALLDRAWGKPTQSITADLTSNDLHLHLVAVQLVSKQLAEERTRPPAIEHEPENTMTDAPTE